MKIKALKGVEDILPEKIDLWNYVHKKATEVFACYGFKQIIIPIIEESKLFTRSIGQETDIVEKEMYAFKDRGQRDIALRPEATASIVRAYLEHNYDQYGLTKLFYSGPMFRGEKPQAGRNRQFYQIGIEALGSYSTYLDAEIIHLAVTMLKAIGIKDFQLLINTVGNKHDKLNYSKALKSFLSKQVKTMCKNCQSRFERNVLRILDCKNPHCQKTLKDAPKVTDSLSEQSLNDFTKLKQTLTALEIDFKEAPHLVRGLDYYTKSVFEITHNNLGAQNTILAGGRYDNLIEELGGNPAGANGFACGVERLLLALESEAFSHAAKHPKSLFAIGLGPRAFNEIFNLVQELRKNGFCVHLGFEPRNIKKSMRQADRLGCDFALILGDDEMDQKTILLKDMHKKEQHIMKLNSVLNELKKFT